MYIPLAVLIPILVAFYTLIGWFVSLKTSQAACSRWGGGCGCWRGHLQTWALWPIAVAVNVAYIIWDFPAYVREYLKERRAEREKAELEAQ